ncbi:MAG TPA: flippase-like domain-containing protein, partial [Candidatus Acetothermia bacterium]|nr:flippase-like domain-containing protein [Candidatus Acetothermia bacterium]
MKRAGVAVLLVGVGLGLFAFILALVGPDAVWKQIQALGLWGFLAMVGNDITATLFWVTSWGVLLYAFGARLRPRDVAGIGIAGFAISYITPIAYLGGEPVRAWLASRKTGASLPTVFATLFVDRLLAGLSLVLFAVLGGAFILTGTLLSPRAKVQVGAGLAVVTAAVLIGVLSFARNYHWLSRIVIALGRLRRSWQWPAAWGEKVHAMEDEMYAAFTRYLPATVLAFALELGSFFCTYLRPQLFFYFTEGRLFTLSDLAVYFNLNAILTTLLWLTPAGMGTAEG